MAGTPQQPNRSPRSGQPTRRPAGASAAQRAVPRTPSGRNPAAVPPQQGGGGLAPTKPRAPGINKSKSIRTKLVIVMSSVAAAILLLIFFLTYQLTSSVLGEEITRTGEGQVHSSRALGSIFAGTLEEGVLMQRLNTARSDNTQDEIDKAFDSLTGAWGLTESSLGFYPASSHGTFKDLYDDLLWTKVANTLALAKAKAAQMGPILGTDYETLRANKDRAPRSLQSDWATRTWPEGANSPSSIQSVASSKAVANAMLGILRTLVDEAVTRAESSLGVVANAKRRADTSQVLGISYAPSATDLAWLDSLKKLGLNISEGDIAELREAARLNVGESIGASENAQSTSHNDIKFYQSQLELNGRSFAVREFVLRGNADEEVRVVVNTQVLGEAESKTTSTLLLVSIVGLVLAIAVSVLLGIAIAKPIQALMQDVTRIASGDFSHRPPVRTKDEIGTLARLVGEMAGSLSVGQQMWQENQARRHDVSMAKEIQENLLPSVVPVVPGYDIGVYYEPSKEVGGDYYDFFTVDKDHLGMVCADVSGKGIPGSMVMMMAKALITNNAQNSYSPREVFIKTNQILAKDIKRGMFVTAYYALLDAATRELRVSSAGHNAMLIYRSSSQEMLSINPSGIALGFDRDGALFEKNVQEEVVELQVGDRVIIYTDGVTEATNAAGEEFGEDRLKAVMQQCGTMASNDFLVQLVGAIEGFANTDDQHDDITIVTFMVTA